MGISTQICNSSYLGLGSRTKKQFTRLGQISFSTFTSTNSSPNSSLFVGGSQIEIKIEIEIDIEIEIEIEKYIMS